MAWFLVILGFAAIFAAFSLGRRVLEIRRWPVVQATIVERGVGAPEIATGGARSARFVPRLVLAYEVAGQRHTSSGRCAVQETMTEAKARAWVDAIPNPSTLHYNPANPSEAYLAPGGLAPAIVALVLGLLAAIAGAAMLFASR